MKKEINSFTTTTVAIRVHKRNAGISKNSCKTPIRTIPQSITKNTRNASDCENINVIVPINDVRAPLPTPTSKSKSKSKSNKPLYSSVV